MTPGRRGVVIRGPPWRAGRAAGRASASPSGAAFEAEFVLVAGHRSGRRFSRTRVACSRSSELDAQMAAGRAHPGDLDVAGVAVHQFAKEYGPGQFEVSLLPTEPLVAADRFLLARQLDPRRGARGRRDGVVHAQAVRRPAGQRPARAPRAHPRRRPGGRPDRRPLTIPERARRDGRAADRRAACPRRRPIGARPRRRRTPTSGCCRARGRPPMSRGRWAIGQR